ncbi:MAG: hypothetical protein EA356_04910 [Geminicoccaceae bacterium]|nr:MAG: hypothetical protein EA356_04910 [Geminicoccaceae bacterium]
MVVLFGVKLAALVGPVASLEGWPLSSTVAAETGPLAVTVEAEALARLAPAAGPPPPAGAAASEPVTAADLLAERLDRLIHPAAGPLGLAGEPLQPEPFLEERRALARQQEAMAVRQVALEMAETRLRQHVARLETLKVELEELIEDLSEEEEERLAALVQLYERMRPKQAAVIFDQLDFAVLVPLSLRMRDMKLAPILGAMQPDVARKLTTEIADRRRADQLAAAAEIIR